MFLSDSETKTAPKAELYELGELEKPARPQAPKDDGISNLSDFQLLFKEGRMVDPRKMAADQADQIRQQAEGELNSARSEVGQIKKEAYEQGFQQGLSEGTASAKARIMAACDNLGRAVEAIDQAKSNLLGNLEAELVALVQAVVERIFLIEGAVHPELIKQVARVSINHLAEADSLTLAVCPSDLEIVEEFAPLLKKGLTSLRHVNIVPDAELHPGDCRVTSPDAQVDSTLATRKERILKVLEDRLQSGEAMDLEELVKAQPPAVQRLLQEETEAKAGVNPSDFGVPPSVEYKGSQHIDDMEILEPEDVTEDDLDW